MPYPERIGRFHVQSVVGLGGFAAVLRARDESLRDTVAIKVLAERWADDAGIRERFLEEARLLRRIRSPHLVTVHDLGELENGQPYFVMEFANRGTLAARFDGRGTAGIDPSSLLSLAAMLAEGLEALHKAGVVHRDVNPHNIFIQDRAASLSRDDRMAAPTRLQTGLINPTERLMLGDLGLAKDLVRAGPVVSVLAGTPSYQAPEQVDPDGEVQPATDIYGATGVLLEALTGKTPSGGPGLGRTLATLDPSWRPFFERGLAALPEERFEGMEPWLDAVRDIAQPELVGRIRPTSRVDLTDADEGPYLGLAAFQPEDATRFFGRDDLVKELVRRLRRERVLVVGGPSGSGKSSVVRAGLIPAISSGAYESSENWPVALFSPRGDPLGELAHQLVRAGNLSGQQLTSGLAAADLVADPRRGRRAAEAITDVSGGLLLVADQFEELFTQSDRQDQERFLDVLSHIIDPTDSRVRLIIVMRADFYSESALFAWLADCISTNQVLVGPMNRTELQLAIEEPARLANLGLEAGLVDAVLDEGGASAGSLPLVSHAMAETWRRRKGRQLTLQAYHQSGGVGGAISQTADEIYARMSPDHQAAARRILLRLVNPGEGTTDTRRPMPAGELSRDMKPEVARSAVGSMVAARLLTVDRDTIEIAHESLIHRWPRLREWIEDSRDDLRTRQRISRAATEWETQGRLPDLLYRGAPLLAAADWSAGHPDDLTTLDREFLDEALAAQRRREEAEAAAVRGSRRVRSIAIAVLATLLVVAVAASIIGFVGFRDASQRLAGALGTQAASIAESDPRLALALAVEASVRGGDTFETRSVLVDATRRLNPDSLAPSGITYRVGDAHNVARQPGRPVLVLGSRDGSLSLYDAGGDGEIATLEGHTKAVEQIAFSADGKRMVTVGQDRALLAWDLGDPTNVGPPTLIAEADDILWGAAVSPDGMTAATAGEDGIVQLWNLDEATPMGEPLTDDDFDMLTVAFSPDGRILLAGNGRGQIVGWDVESRQVALERFDAHGSDIWEIVFSPDGQSVASVSADGGIRLWSLTGELVSEPFADSTEDVRGVQFLSEELLVAGDDAGRVRGWDLAQGAEVFASGMAHSRQVIAGASSLGGGHYTTLSLDQTVIDWTFATDPRMMTGFSGGAFGLAVDHDGTRLAVGDGEGRVAIFDAASRDSLAGPITVGSDAVWALAFGDDGELFAGTAEGSLVAIDIDRATVVETAPAAHTGSVTALAIHGARIFSGGEDGIVRVWSTELQPAGNAMRGHSGGVTDIDVGSGGVVAVSDRSGQIHFWDSDQSAADETLQADDNTIWGLAWSPDSSQLAAASDDEAVIIFDAETQQPLISLTPHPGGAADVEFLADGSLVATTSRDGSVRLFDVMLGRQLGSVAAGHGGPSWRVAAIPDSRTFVTSGEDGLVGYWDELDLEAACARSGGGLDADNRRRYLGAGEEAAGCR